MAHRQTRKYSNPETSRIEGMISKWISLYQAGSPATTIARMYGVHPSTVYRRLHWNEVSVRTRSEVKLAELNPMWRGHKVNNSGLHIWVRSRLPKSKTCQECNRLKPLDLANISDTYNPHTYTRDLSNWRWLCRQCHMRIDGRIKNMYHGGMKPRHTHCTICPRRHEARGYCSRHYNQFMRLGRVWL